MQLGQGFCASDEKYILALFGCKLAPVHVGLWAKASVAWIPSSQVFGM
jgi:hypothetical protein